VVASPKAVSLAPTADWAAPSAVSQADCEARWAADGRSASAKVFHKINDTKTAFDKHLMVTLLELKGVKKKENRQTSTNLTRV
jgi:hypothetical protein